MKIDFKYKIQEINYREGFITVDYLLEEQPNTTVTVNYLIPNIDGRYISGLDLEQFVLDSFPAQAFNIDTTANDKDVVSEEIEYDNTQLKFEGKGIFDTEFTNRNEAPDDAGPDFELEEYTRDINENYSAGSTVEYLRVKRIVLKVLEELNIIK